VFAELLLMSVAVYVSLGLIFASAFVTVGVGRIDPAARGSAALFRLLIVPGTVALWPVLARRWWKGSHS
jgi:hypothetical protein